MSEFYKHLVKRCKSDPSLFGMVDYENEIFTRYLWAFTGNIYGYVRYNWKGSKKSKNPYEGKYFTWTSKKHPTLLGIENLRINEPIYLVEGMFEQITGFNYGLNCLAVLTNNTKPLREWIKCTPNTVISLCQPDKASLELAKYTDDCMILPKDLDEMTEVEVYRFFNEYDE